jgi:ribose transport system substrate-binding protein
MSLVTLRNSLALAAPLCVVTLLAGACSSTSGAEKTSSAAESSNSAVTTVKYDGPETILPTSIPTPPPTTKAFTVGYMEDYSGVRFLVATAEKARATVEQLGGKMIIKDAALNPQTQVTQFYELLSQHVDAIIVHPVDPAALGPALKKAAADGVPVIGLNATTAGSDPLPAGYRQTFNEALDVAAYSMVQRAAAQRPGGSLVLMGTSIPIPTVQYELTRLSYWSSRFGMKLLGRIDNNNDTPSGYGAAATTLVARYPKAQIVIAYNDPFALTVAQVLRASNITTALVSSAIGGEQDAFDAVKVGRLDSTYAMPWLTQGQLAAYAAYQALLSPQTALPPVVNPHGTLVTKANASSVPAAG